MQNLEITCYLKSPLTDKPPNFDALLGWVKGIEQKSFCEKTTNVNTLIDLDIPIEKEYFGQYYFYKCSDPIFHIEEEWTERWSKKIDIHNIILKSKKHPTVAAIGKGKYKSIYNSVICRNIKLIKYFVQGNKNEIERILNLIYALGTKRSYGYGFIDRWELIEKENDSSIFYQTQNGKYLMKTIPADYLYCDIINKTRQDFGRYRFPYWHPNKSMILIPC